MRSQVLYETTCQWCHHKFLSRSKSAQFCPDCKKERERQLSRERKTKHNAKKDVAVTVKKMNELNQIANKAMEMGLTYGQYVAKFGGQT